MFPQKSSLVHSSRVDNLWFSSPCQYLLTSPGTRYYIEFYLVVNEVYYEVSCLGSDVSSIEGFLLGGPGSEVGSTEEGLLGPLQGPCGYRYY